MNVGDLLSGYDVKKLTVGALGGHSALDVAHGAKKYGFHTLVVAQEGRERTYSKYFKSRSDVIEVKKFNDVLDRMVQEQLRAKHTIFIHNRYFWTYIEDFARVENDFHVPIFGSRSLLKIEERDQPYNQYHLLQDAGIRSPKLFAKPEDIEIGRMVIVKAHEAQRGYERAFFLATASDFEARANEKIKRGEITKEGLKAATIEEFVVGAPVNFNFFYSPITEELELLGTDMRRQTNLDGFLRMTAEDQTWAKQFTSLKMIETGHVACTVKESILEKAFDLGERFVRATKAKKCDPTGRGIIGPFALQGAVVADEGREDIVIFDVSMRVPGSPGIRATPYSGYLYGESMSMGERIGMELRKAVREKALELVIS